ncbi:MAG: 2-oxoacid:acceptor oxidoreductase [Clostridium sp. SCN 57-10]|nr:MAG: 2-oxoacid:acceptor oxidoreductase [Clostridium sp. SCN 57-10]
MAKVVFTEDRCKACGLCIEVCPRKILALKEGVLNKKGYSPCHCIDESKCIGCAMCATMCPDCVIEVYR